MQQIDIREVIKSKSPNLERRLPGFIIRYLEKTIHQQEVNEALKRFGHLYHIEFITAALNAMGITYQSYGTDNIPDTGRFVFVSNHPLGGLDGLVFMKEVGSYFPAIKFPVNDLLLNIRNLSGIFLPVNKHGAQGRNAARDIEKAYSSDSQILYFPAGLCSRKQRGTICDLPWHKSFISKAVTHERDVIPVFISGRNSSFFYNLANIRRVLGIKANIEMLYLVDEMFQQKGKSISITFGKPIPYTTFDKSKRPEEWALYVRKKCYALKP